MKHDGQIEREESGVVETMEVKAPRQSAIFESLISVQPF